MSLLLEALKKAEKEKKRASENLAKEAGDAGTVLNSNNGETEPFFELAGAGRHDDLSIEENGESVSSKGAVTADALTAENVSEPSSGTFNGTFYEGTQESDVLEETRPDMPAGQLSKDAGKNGCNVTPVVARTVFSTGVADQNASVYRWFVPVILVFLAAGSFALFYYFSVTPVVRDIPKHMVVDSFRLNNAPSPEGNVVSGEEVNAGGSVADAGHYVLETPVNEDPGGLASDPVTNVVEKTEKTRTDHAVVPEETMLIARTAFEKFSDLESIGTRKRTVPEQHGITVGRAYAAYQSRQYALAETLYREVLEKVPGDRDSLLGLAAIAVNEGDRAGAYGYYVRLLELNPGDAVALNALINLSGNIDPVADEGAIKFLLKENSDAPWLYFSLGNLYAKQERWPEAQQAFFKSYQLDTSNPNYAFNLAVSLDRLTRYTIALDYYKKALDLARSGITQFDLVSVKKRIVVLGRLRESDS